MDITIHINAYVFWFVAGMLATVVCKYLWHKIIVPGYVYLITKIDDHNRSIEEEKVLKSKRPRPNRLKKKYEPENDDEVDEVFSFVPIKSRDY